MALLALAVTAARPAEAAQWAWQLPAARYQKLNPFERRQYDKAAALVESKNYKAAADEFEKFKAEFPDSPLLAYMLFMRGYCLDRANNRITAIKVHQEVIDYFQDSVEDCAAALYCLGVSHLDNGDTAKGIKALRTLADDPRYKDHPLTAGALRRLGDDCWTRRQCDEAVAFWKQLVARYAGRSDDEVKIAADHVTAWYVKNRDYAGYEAWLVTDENRDNARVREQFVENAYNVAWHGFQTDWEKYAAASEKEKIEKDKLKAQDMQGLYLYLKGGKGWYEKAGDLWRYHDHAMRFLTSFWTDRAAREAATDDAVAMVKQIKDKADADQKFSVLADCLREQRQYDRARYVLALMQDRNMAAYKDAELLSHDGKWKPAIARLEEVEHGGSEPWKQRALWEHARICKDATAEYEKAIQLYHQINQPPANLWQIQDAYHRWGKLKESLAALSEIESMFPDDAPRAAWHKATYCIQAGDRKAAIAQSRRIMKMYPKSPESAQAHRWLEDNGVPSGGGVSDQ